MTAVKVTQCVKVSGNHVAFLIKAKLRLAAVSRRSDGVNEEEPGSSALLEPCRKAEIFGAMPFDKLRAGPNPLLQGLAYAYET
jgi:hypothetical protein